MYRIKLFLLIVFVSSVSPWASEGPRCFKQDGKTFQMTTIKKDQVVVCLKGSKEYCGMYFCQKVKGELRCQGDDDTGSFTLQKDLFYLTSALMLGTPDDSLRVESSKKERKKLKACEVQKSK